MRRVLAAAIAALAAGCGAAAGEPDALVVAAASDLRPMFAELGESFEDETGRPVTFVFGSSGQLAQQVIEGAPVDLYVSANVAYVDDVVAAGRGDPATQRVYAVGRIVVWSRTDAWGGWAGLDDLAADPAVRTLSIANPDHAPYGAAARDALTTAGVWDALQGRLVYGENIADTQRIAESGNAEAAISALSLAIDAGARGTWTLVPDDLHPPIAQALVVVADDPERADAAAAFVAHVTSEAGQEALRRYGFEIPDA